ncbi:hypothetical protein MRX96_050135 [Rhipicephalus microplus]
MSHVVKCLVDVPHLHMKRPYTLSNGTFEDLKQAIAVCPLLGNLVALSTSRFQVPEKSSFFDLQETSGIKLTELSSCADDHGSSFVLPSFGALHNIITSGEPITSSLQRKIVDVLFGEMLKFTILTLPRASVIKLLNIFKKAMK